MKAFQVRDCRSLADRLTRLVVRPGSALVSVLLVIETCGNNLLCLGAGPGLRGDEAATYTNIEMMSSTAGE